MTNKPPKIFLDVDGVFADYEGDYRRLTGGDPSEKGKTKAGRFRDYPHFYLHLPLMPDAMKLWNFVKQYEPSFLTAVSNYLKSSREDKQSWLQHHFQISGHRAIIVNYPVDKVKHVIPGAILVDDNAKNCDEWVRAGGVAILHKSAEATIHKLRELLGHQDTKHVVEAFQALQEQPCANLVEALNTLEELD